MALLVLVGVPLSAFFLTWVAGRGVGWDAAKVVFFLTGLPVVWALLQVLRFWQVQSSDGMAAGISAMGLAYALVISLFSLAGLWLARPRPKSRTEAGTGLNP